MDARYRQHGKKPCKVVVVHGGPGGAGGVRPVAEHVCRRFGVLEPLQTQMTVDGQVEELVSTIVHAAHPPVVLIGHSWGAWLAWLTASRHAELVRKLILVGSGGFRPADGRLTHRTRMERLDEELREELHSLHAALTDARSPLARSAFARFGALFASADGYDLVPHEDDEVEYRPDIYASVWPEAAGLRANGELLEAGRAIRCPVVAFHGDYDPAPLAGIREPMAEVLDDPRVIVLAKCGHEPWRERHAKETFFRLLGEEIASALVFKQPDQHLERF